MKAGLIYIFNQSVFLDGIDMVTVGAFEAKTQLSALLDRVENGEEVLITRHGKPIARLVPEATAVGDRLDDVVAALRKMRKHTTLGGSSWKELRDEGRK